ncbi:hypothetical protein CH29_gp12 [Achromobacter phage JWAlpha]|uniref:Uncharacterized protein n=1 Tax=Achromobacter phage JWAlpha TaxID=1416009 RepID=V9VF52_9CAUD|nr:hypothetical protein CH29_gp12 [Achromobacter phage JWAlpha]AHC93965.1 hypothetical protein JJJB_0012 [Achromobacter phage JWAlpha]
MKDSIFVFGSNTAGIHGAGAALTAYQKHSARHGIGYGLCGQSFAIPTKDKFIQTLSIRQVEQFVAGFLAFARDRDDLDFMVTRIGCGLAGFSDEEMARLFVWATPNCFFDTKWVEYLPIDQGIKFWGTF